MVGRLAKLASVSSGLRAGVEKRAGLINKALGAVGAIGSVGTAIGKTKQFKAGFDPAAQQAATGLPPQERP